jgi:hypothetical protein
MIVEHHLENAPKGALGTGIGRATTFTLMRHLGAKGWLGSACAFVYFSGRAMSGTDELRIAVDGPGCTPGA